MSTNTRPGRPTPTSQRGRNVPTKKRSLLPLFLIVGLVVVIGGIIAAVNLGQDTTPPAESAIPANQAIRTLNAPVGQTDDGFYYKGDPDAPVEVIEYADFQCPSCGAFFQSLRPPTHPINQYVENGQIQFIYHEFPLQQHQNAIPAASAARCAADQGPENFWKMHDLLFARQGEWPNDRNVAVRFSGYARELGIDQAAFDQCMQSGQHTEDLQAAAQAAAAAGVSGTPTFSVNGELVRSTELQAAIDAALQANE